MISILSLNMLDFQRKHPKNLLRFSRKLLRILNVKDTTDSLTKLIKWLQPKIRSSSIMKDLRHTLNSSMLSL